MATKRVGIIMYGVTGRMGTNQHLVRSILEIRRQGGVMLKDGTSLMPDPILVGRDAAKLERLAKVHNLERWTTDLNQALANKNDSIFFDAASTQLEVGPGMRPRLRPFGAAVATALLFALFHMKLDVIPILFLLGLHLNWVRERTGGLMAPIAAHACYNAYQMAGVWLAR